MQRWHIRLNKGTFGTVGDITSGGLLSTYEMDYKRRGQAAVSDKVSEPRNALFGVGNSNVTEDSFARYNNVAAYRMPTPPMQPQPPQMPQAQLPQAQMQQAYQHKAQASSLSGSQNAQHSTRVSGLFGNLAGKTNAPSGLSPFEMAIRRGAGNEDYSEVEVEYDGAGEIIISELPSLDTQESEWPETGMTTSYDIPGLPTFLKAHIHNTSSITLLKGPVGLSLNGSFLGNASLPICSAGELFSLSLGVDPSVNVNYSKPVVKSSQISVSQKEGSDVYACTIIITNTKSNRPVESLILDEIPVSKNERLKVHILQPFGLRSEGDTAKSGVGMATVGKVTEKWGSARAMVKKEGEVSWNINLEPGRGVKLVLEYEARFPSTEVVVGC